MILWPLPRAAGWAAKRYSVELSYVYMGGLRMAKMDLYAVLSSLSRCRGLCRRLGCVSDNLGTEAAQKNIFALLPTPIPHSRGSLAEVIRVQQFLSTHRYFDQSQHAVLGLRLGSGPRPVAGHQRLECGHSAQA